MTEDKLEHLKKLHNFLNERFRGMWDPSMGTINMYIDSLWDAIEELTPIYELTAECDHGLLASNLVWKNCSKCGAHLVDPKSAIMTSEEAIAAIAWLRTELEKLTTRLEQLEPAKPLQIAIHQGGKLRGIGDTLAEAFAAAKSRHGDVIRSTPQRLATGNVILPNVTYWTPITAALADQFARNVGLESNWSRRDDGALCTAREYNDQ